MTDTAPRGPVQTEGLTNIDGEPLFGWHWSDTPPAPSNPHDLTGGDQWARALSTNRNITPLRTMTPRPAND